MRARLFAAAVVVAVAAAACVSVLLSTNRQYALSTQCGGGPCGSPPGYDFGTQPIGTKVFTSPGSDSYFLLSDATQTDLITSIARDQNCSSDFQLLLPPPGDSDGDTFGSSVPIGCAGGGGTGCGTTQCTGNMTYAFGASFKPSHSFAQSCLVHVVYMNSVSGAGSADFQLNGAGSAQTFDMQITNPTVDPFAFGNVPTNTDSAKSTLVLQNTGTAQLNVTGVVGGSDPSQFPVTPVGAITLGSFVLAPAGMAGDTAKFDVDCHPTAAGALSATLTFTTGVAEGNLMRSEAFTCTGVSTSVNLSPNSFDYGKVLLGSTPPALQRMVKLSVTSGTVTVSSFTLTPAAGVAAPAELHFDSTPPSPTTITPTMPLNLVVDFAPTAEHTSGTLGVVTFSDGANMLSLPILTGSYTGSIGTVPAAVDFGTVCAGVTPQPSQQLEVYANASGDVQILPDSTLPGAPFSATPSPSLPTTLGGFHSGPSLFVTTTLDTSTSSDKPFTDQILLDTNIPGAMPKRAIPVTATILPPGISATPGSVAFTPLKIRSTSAPQIVTLINCGTTPLTVTDTLITGANPDDFGATPLDQTLPAMLNPTDKLMFVVQMTPTGVGPRVASLQIAHSAGSTSVDLTGQGIGNDRQTYYACSSGRPVGIAPVALALAFALRRRRRASARR